MSAEASGARLGPPIKVLLTESAGRGVFSTRSIASGELIHTAKPLITHPSLSLSDGSCCYCCLRKLSKDASTGRFSSWKEESGSYSFCSEQCRDESKGFYEFERKVDWSLYHDHCRAQGLKYPLMVKRFACMVISGTVSADVLDILQPANLQQEMEEEFQLLNWSLLKAQVEQKLIGFLTNQWYVSVLSRIRINSFRIELVAASHEDLLASATASVAGEAAVGNALYMLPSFYNHDCDPNTHIVWIDNAAAKLKALRRIEEGEELRICYLDASMDRDARQKLLYEGFGFHCRCFRCSSGD